MARRVIYEDEQTGLWKARRRPSRSLSVQRYLDSLEDTTLYTDDVSGLKPYGWESVPSDYEITFSFTLEHVGKSGIPLPESLSSYIGEGRGDSNYPDRTVEVDWVVSPDAVSYDIALIYVTITQVLRGEMFQVGAESVGLGSDVLSAERNANIVVNELSVKFTSMLMSANEYERGDAFVSILRRDRVIRYVGESSSERTVITPFGGSKEVASIGTEGGRLFAEQGEAENQLFLREMSVIQAEQDAERRVLADQGEGVQYPTEGETPPETTRPFGEGQPPTEGYGEEAYDEYADRLKEAEYEFASDEGPELIHVDDVEIDDVSELPINEGYIYPKEEPTTFSVNADESEGVNLGALFGADLDEQELERQRLERIYHAPQRPTFVDRISAPINMVLKPVRGIIDRLLGGRR